MGVLKAFLLGVAKTREIKKVTTSREDKKERVVVRRGRFLKEGAVANGF
ncbi:MAG: hypothetical protein QOJ42_854, partial [Acidobacteriaceae bacterium]|nr:hypothetical protein [Acidobacteriaceae bacterium]